MKHLLFLLVSGVCAFGASSPQAASYLSDQYEHASYEEALERIKSQPNRHVMVYFGMFTMCPPCNYTRNILNGPDMLEKYKDNYVVVSINLRNPTEAQKPVVDKFKARWAPTLVFVDHTGRLVQRVSRGFNNAREAVLTNEFIAQRIYRKTDLNSYIKANFELVGTDRRVVEQTKPADPRRRLGEILALNHEIVSADDLRRGLANSVLLHETYVKLKTLQVIDQTLKLGADGTIEAAAKNRNSAYRSTGKGTWKVQDDGRLCVETAWPKSVESWCRIVYRVGEDFYTANSSDPDAVVRHFVYATASGER